jgi:hypothetical protein
MGTLETRLKEAGLDKFPDKIVGKKFRITAPGLDAMGTIIGVGTSTDEMLRLYISIPYFFGWRVEYLAFHRDTKQWVLHTNNDKGRTDSGSQLQIHFSLLL